MKGSGGKLQLEKSELWRVVISINAFFLKKKTSEKHLKS